MSKFDARQLPPYRLEWRAVLTTGWILVRFLDEHPGDLAEYVRVEARIAGQYADAEQRMWGGGQFRLISQHVTEVAGLGA